MAIYRADVSYFKDKEIMLHVVLPTVKVFNNWSKVTGELLELSQSTFQSSNPIGQYSIHISMHICAIALATP